MRFLVVVVMILAAIEIAAADKKSSTNSTNSTKSTKPAIEIDSYSFGISNAPSMNAKRQGSAPSPVGNAEKSGSKH
jgi:hypothetical protein